jgi:hypothetical protein
MTRLWLILDGSSHDASKAILERETQSRLARNQPWAGKVVTTRPRPTSSRRHNHHSPDAIPRVIRSHDSPEANLG